MTRLSSPLNPSGTLISPLYTESHNKSKNLAVFQFAAPLHNIHVVYFLHVCECVDGEEGVPDDTSLLALLASIIGTGEVH